MRVRVSVELHTAGLTTERLASEIETTLYRIAQEALNNIAKHARASHVEIILERRADQVSLIVEDDRRGIRSERDGRRWARLRSARHARTRSTGRRHSADRVRSG